MVSIGKPTPEDEMWELMKEFLDSFDLNGWMFEGYIPSDVKKEYVQKFLQAGKRKS